MLIRLESSATKTASRCGPILGMAINAALLEVLTAEVEDIHFHAILVV
jgi:hypothetical protein